METVQLQCGHCKQVIAIGVDHLGGQVQCPHCKGVLQTPPRDPQPAAVAPMPNMELNQRESIFAGSESSDQVLGEPETPKVELPSVEAPSSADPAAEPHADLTQFKPRRPVFDRGVLALYGFIFLIPYAILTTLAVGYFLFMQPARPHPFDLMPDPVPDKKGGGPRKAMILKHDSALADHQRVALGKSIVVGKDGDLQVTVEQVRLTAEGDLKLYLRAKNISTNTAFVPMHDAFIRYVAKAGVEPPYTFLESKSKAIENLYNPTLEFRKGTKDSDESGRDLLAPNEETTIVLTTSSLDRTPHVAAIAKSKDTFTWRVQLRRGFVKWREKEVSATAVIGIDFTSDQIVRDGKG